MPAKRSNKHRPTRRRNSKKSGRPAKDNGQKGGATADPANSSLRNVKGPFFHDGSGVPFTLHEDRYRFLLLVLVVLGEIVTLCLTWTLWETRETPINLPLMRFPLPFGILMVASLILSILKPRIGTVAHAVVLALACMDDQYRVQPQFITFAILLLALVYSSWLWYSRWYLAALWVWTGIHKLASPEWLGSVSWSYLKSSGVSNPDDWHFYFAVAIGVVEIGLGLLAVWMVRPYVAYGCAVLHICVLVSLSPLSRNHNEAVWGWNLILAVVGYWIFTQDLPKVKAGWQFALLAVTWVMPVGFYFNLVNPHMAFVLYSGYEPTAYHTSTETLKRLDGYNGNSYPFPNSTRLFVQTFELTGEPGDKLYVDDPRLGMQDRYYLLQENGRATEITRERFYRYTDDEVRGAEVPNYQSVWVLERADVELETRDESEYYLARYDGEKARIGLESIWELPNLAEVVVSNTTITSTSSAESKSLYFLEILQFDNCQIPLEAWQNLAAGPAVRWIQASRTRVSADVVDYLVSLEELQVLRLVDCELADAELEGIHDHPNLSWIDVKGTKVSSAGIQALHDLPMLNWLDLSETDVDDFALRSLKRFPNLQILSLNSTKVTNGGIEELRELPQLQQLDLVGTNIDDDSVEVLVSLKRLIDLDVRKTQLSANGLKRLRQRLPNCRIRFE